MLSKTHRLRGRRDPRIVLKHGRSLRSGPLGAKYLINKNRDDYRVAIMVSTKISKSAPKRNRIRRRIYEAVRLNPPAVAGLDMVISAYDLSLATMEHEELATHVKKLLEQAVH